MQRHAFGAILAFCILFGAHATSAAYNWQDFFTFDEHKTISQQVESQVLKKLKSNDPKWEEIIRSRHIENASIKLRHINDNGCSADQVMQYDGSEWQCHTISVDDLDFSGKDIDLGSGDLTATDVIATRYVQFDMVSGEPSASDCDAVSEYGRTALYDSGCAISMYICSDDGWVQASLYSVCE